MNALVLAKPPPMATFTPIMCTATGLVEGSIKVAGKGTDSATVEVACFICFCNRLI
jgi:hypothetical protein